LLDYIRANLKPKYKIGMLSNAGGNWLKELFDEEDIKLFDAVVLSAEIGVSKPDPRAFQIATDRLGVKFEESIFVDDLQHYVEAARALGMKAIHYKNYQQTIDDIERLLAADSNN
jgi:epoxide hydrolase-like predicted phosphatase